MRNVEQRLEAWRQAERRRDSLVAGSAEWQEADEDVRAAQKAYHAEVAQASARGAELAYQDRNHGWFPEMDRRVLESGDSAR